MSLFFLLLAALGVAGAGLLTRLGASPALAWGGGRLALMLFAAWPALLVGGLGLGDWRLLQSGTLIAGVVLGLILAGPALRSIRDAFAGELAFWLGTGFVACVRWGRPGLVDTEKFMDLGILATLLRSPQLPPADMWLSGTSLPYYFFGAQSWIPVIEISGLPLEIAANLIVAALGGLVAQLAWGLGHSLGLSRRAAFGGAVLAGFAGTPGGFAQFSANGLSGIDLWASSRGVANAITEFPLFTLWLGDLHPHLYSMPIALLAFAAALDLGRKWALRPRPRLLAAWMITVLAIGSSWAANPWSMPPTLGGAMVLTLVASGRLRWPETRNRGLWLAALALAPASWLAFAPFHLAYEAPVGGVGLVFAATELAELAGWGGHLLLPILALVALAAWELRGRVGALRPLGFSLACVVLMAALLDLAGPQPAKAAALLTLGGACLVLLLGELGTWRLPRKGAELEVSWIAAAMLVLAIAASGRPVLAVLMLALLMLAPRALGSCHDRWRPAWMLTLFGLVLLVIPELVYLVDPYGDLLHRQNTIFKAWIQAWPLLAISVPFVLAQLSRRFRALGLAIGTAILVLGLAHPVHLAWRAGQVSSGGFDGLAWMGAGDRAAVAELRTSPPRTTLIEAVGGAYSHHGRLSVSSGVPALLGWANHESVWRGGSLNPEVERRRQLIETIYAAVDPAESLAMAAAAGVDLVAIGDLERSTHGAQVDRLARHLGLEPRLGMTLLLPTGEER